MNDKIYLKNIVEIDIVLNINISDKFKEMDSDVSFTFRDALDNEKSLTVNNINLSFNKHSLSESILLSCANNKKKNLELKTFINQNINRRTK